MHVNICLPESQDSLNGMINAKELTRLICLFYRNLGKIIRDYCKKKKKTPKLKTKSI